MHHGEVTEIGRHAVEIMEHHFVSSPAGRAYQAQYAQLAAQQVALEKQYAEFWAAAKPDFVAYLRDVASNPR